MSRRRRRELWWSVPGSFVVKLVIPTKEGISNQGQICAWKMGKESWSQFHDFRKKLLEAEGWCPPVG